MTLYLEMRESRLVARVVNLAERFGCAVRRLALSPRGDTYEARIEFAGEADALRRLRLSLARVSADEDARLRV